MALDPTTNRADRHVVCDDAAAQFIHEMDKLAEANRARDQVTIDTARRLKPLDWADVAAYVTDNVWERILDDMPRSRASLEAIRPSTRQRHLRLVGRDPLPPHDPDVPAE